MARTDAARRATAKFEAKAYDKITIRIRKDRPDFSGLTHVTIQEAADRAGMSLNAFIVQAIAEKVEKTK